MTENNEQVQKFWQEFLEAKGLDDSTELYESFYFANEEWADKLLALVLQGKKTATCGCVPSYEAEGQCLPQAGDYSIVTNYAGDPHCVIQVKTATVLPFNEVTWDMARLEGEDEVMQTWVDGHRRFFQLEADQYGFEFSDDTLVCFETFEVVYATESREYFGAALRCRKKCLVGHEGFEPSTFGLRVHCSAS